MATVKQILDFKDQVELLYKGLRNDQKVLRAKGLSSYDKDLNECYDVFIKTRDSEGNEWMSNVNKIFLEFLERYPIILISKS